MSHNDSRHNHQQKQRTKEPNAQRPTPTPATRDRATTTMDWTQPAWLVYGIESTFNNNNHLLNASLPRVKRLRLDNSKQTKAARGPLHTNEPTPPSCCVNDVLLLLLVAVNDHVLPRHSPKEHIIFIRFQGKIINRIVEPFLLAYNLPWATFCLVMTLWIRKDSRKKVYLLFSNCHQLPIISNSESSSWYRCSVRANSWDTRAKDTGSNVKW